MIMQGAISLGYSLKRIVRASVWAVDGVTPSEWRYRGLLRFVLPLSDALILWFAVDGFFASNIDTISDHVGGNYAHWWALTLAIGALFALVGLSFPRLWAFELVGRIAYVALICGYLGVEFASVVHDPHTAAQTSLGLALVLLPGWRVGDLGYIWWQRRVE